MWQYLFATPVFLWWGGWQRWECSKSQLHWCRKQQTGGPVSNKEEDTQCYPSLSSNFHRQTVAHSTHCHTGTHTHKKTHKNTQIEWSPSQLTTLSNRKNGNNFTPCCNPCKTHDMMQYLRTVVPTWNCLDTAPCQGGWASSHLLPLQMVAKLSGCATSNSKGLVHCLRDKSVAEILAINKVGTIVWLLR